MPPPVPRGGSDIGAVHCITRCKHDFNNYRGQILGLLLNNEPESYYGSGLSIFQLSLSRQRLARKCRAQTPASPPQEELRRPSPRTRHRAPGTAHHAANADYPLGFPIRGFARMCDHLGASLVPWSLHLRIHVSLVPTPPAVYFQ